MRHWYDDHDRSSNDWGWLAVVVLLCGLLVVLATTSCGTKADPNDHRFLAVPVEKPTQFVDHDFFGYLVMFETDAQRYGAPDGRWDELWRMEYGAPGELESEGLWGYCEVAKAKNAVNGKQIGDLYRFIVIEPTIPSEILRKHTIYHELGHCIYDLGESEQPDQIMSPDGIGDPIFWEAVWQDRVRQFFWQVREVRGLNEE